MKFTGQNCTLLPNELFDYWLPILNVEELKVAIFMLGNKIIEEEEESKIVNQLASKTGLKEKDVCDALVGLREKGALPEKKGNINE